jgi:tRNA (guanine10-N2)-dimethyltransferase
MQALLVGSGWHPSLFRAEMEVLCKNRPFRFGTRVVLVNSDYDFTQALTRSATLDECLSPFGMTSDISTLEKIIEGWIMDETLPQLSNKSIAVRWMRIEGGVKGVNGKKLAMYCGEIFTNLGWKIDLESPDIELMIVLDGVSQHIFWGKRVISISPRDGWSQRVATERPFFKPISLDPRLARIALNLVIDSNDQIICDPMCGTGGVLLEGALLNQPIVGIDLDEEMVFGSRINLDWLNEKQNLSNLQKVFHGNAVNTAEILSENKIKIGGLVFDPPYGKNAWKSEETWDLLSNVLKNSRTAEGIDINSYLVCFLPILPGLQGIDEPISGNLNVGDYSTEQIKLIFANTGWNIISMHAIPIHGSLARMLVHAIAN